MIRSLRQNKDAMAATKRNSGKGGNTARQYVDRLANPTFQKRLEKALRKWTDRTAPTIEAVRASEQLTEKDFAIRINAKG
jgi:hypothetical protein